PQGHGIAHVLLLILLGLVLAEVVLAWQFGHYSSVATVPGEQVQPRKPGVKEWALWSAPWLLFAALLLILFILAHDAWTCDFLGLMPRSFGGTAGRPSNSPPPAPGEGSRWRLEYSSYLWDARSDPWLVGTFVVLSLAGVALIYRQEGHDIRTGIRGLLVALR